MKLPELTEDILGVDELYLPESHHKGASRKHYFAKRIVDDLNGESKSERVELSIGGYVKVSNSEFEWVDVESRMESVGEEDATAFHVAMITKDGMEVSFSVMAHTGEIREMNIMHESQMGREI